VEAELPEFHTDAAAARWKIVGIRDSGLGIRAIEFRIPIRSESRIPNPKSRPL